MDEISRYSQVERNKTHFGFKRSINIQENPINSVFYKIADVFAESCLKVAVYNWEYWPSEKLGKQECQH